eukprot:TRINITY_DN4269_c0_g1_i4.p1 TRINITY_DN4269_c0_g1~~TRINITY_DN4269_c0_g1_i4.p1  ORF type:complete len:425 (+),score=80.91 TRINITY_DN4269_c0_g1_i4:33-1307(+)
MAGEREQVELRKRLENLLQVNENKFCADCGTRGTGWASTNLGIFVCLRCSGIHRHMGTHISKVKSCTLDKWTHELVENMERMGNARAKSIYEAKVPPNYPRPSGDQFSLEQWIRKKYERREFFNAEGASAPAPAAATPSAAAVVSPPTSSYTPQTSSVRHSQAPTTDILDLLGPLDSATTSPAALSRAAPSMAPQSAPTHVVHPGWNSAPATPSVQRMPLNTPTSAPAPAPAPANTLLSMSADTFEKPKVSNQDILQMYGAQQRPQVAMGGSPSWNAGVQLGYPPMQMPQHQQFHQPGYYSYLEIAYFGIIDVLQQYNTRKKLEHLLKSVRYEGDNISIVQPSYYAKRFVDFITSKFGRESEARAILEQRAAEERKEKRRSSKDKSKQRLKLSVPKEKDSKASAVSDDESSAEETRGKRSNTIY